VERPNRDLTWLPDSSGILFIAGNTSISNAIWRVTYPAGKLEQITNDLNNYYLLSVAGDSNTLVTIQRTRDVALWIAPDSDAKPCEKNNAQQTEWILWSRVGTR
jgi:Tol biopolymer transport system component